MLAPRQWVVSFAFRHRHLLVGNAVYGRDGAERLFPVDWVSLGNVGEHCRRVEVPWPVE